MRFVSNDQNGDSTDRRRPAASAADTELLDAYSQAVIRVVENVTPAVISLTGRPGDSPRGSGSGFVISEEGHAITNSHVVARRKHLIAETSDGDRVDATVIGDDPATDIALLKVAASELPRMTLGDSQALRVGQLVIAIGSPHGLQSTVSTGVVSALGRAMRGDDGRLIENIVQHAAPINPGNSGGPLVDSRGHAVGVNTAIIARAQGLGFAVPSNTAAWVVDEILAHGAVRRRQLGVTATVGRAPRSLVRKLDLLSEQAVQVIDTLPGGAAEQAGVQPGDLLVAMNDRVIANIDDLHRLLSLIPEHALVTITLVRENRKLDVTLNWS